MTHEPVGSPTIDPTWEATFIPVDPPRGSWFALWNPDQPGGVFTADLKTTDVDLRWPGPRASRRDRAATVGQTSVETVTAARLPMREAIDLLAQLPTRADVRPSVAMWASVVRHALGLIGRGRMLPWVSPNGWDTWRLDPLDGVDLQHVEALAAAMPAFGHCHPAGRQSIMDPEFAVRSCFDAVADRLVRTPAAGIVSSSDVFADLQASRVRHLRPWVTGVAGPLCRNGLLAMTARPPTEVIDGNGEPSGTTQWQLDFQLRSARDPSLLIAATDLWGRPDETFAQFGDRAELDLLSGLQQAAEMCPVLAPALDQPRPQTISLDDQGFDQFLDSLDELHAVGVDVRFPANLVSADLERRLVVGGGAPGDSMATVNDIKSLLSVNWEFLLDGKALTPAELEVLAEAKRPLVPLRGQWVRLSAKARQRLRAPVPELQTADLLAAAIGDGLGSRLFGADELTPHDLDDLDVRAEGAVAVLSQALGEVLVGREEPEPPGLDATLRPYQRRGLAWMADLASLGLGGCLADDMGLGKTIQVLALHQLRSGPTLVVCPTSLMANWEREAGRFLPGAPVRRYHGPNRSLEGLDADELVVTTYGVVRSDAEKLGSVSWDLYVADEAQHAKNPRSRTARSLRQISASSRIALTGTPVENRLTELWSILDWAVPGLLGQLDTFRRQVAVRIERDDDQATAERLARVLAPFLLRRVKTDPEIAPELPPKTERNVVVPLTTEQISLYQATTKEALVNLARNEGLVRHGLILRLLTGLKQITNHPAQYLGESHPLAGRSGKLDALDDLLDRAHLAAESCLVFSQYVAMGELLVTHLNDRGVEVALLHGGLSVNQRQTLIDRFQAGELPVLVLSLKAGGTGLNLTRATHVIHFDRWWNPAVEDQATDRAHRLGQEKPVIVHRLVTEGTVEDRIAELLDNKRRLADRVVGEGLSAGGESWIQRLDDDELADLVVLDPALIEGDR